MTLRKLSSRRRNGPPGVGLPDGVTVHVKSYSPSTGTFKTDPQNQFVLKLNPPLGLS